MQGKSKISAEVREQGYFGLFLGIVKTASEDYKRLKDKPYKTAEEEHWYRTARVYLFSHKQSNSLHALCHSAGLDVNLPFIHELLKGREFKWTNERTNNESEELDYEQTTRRMDSITHDCPDTANEGDESLLCYIGDNFKRRND